MVRFKRNEARVTQYYEYYCTYQVLIVVFRVGKVEVVTQKTPPLTASEQH